MTMPHDSTLSGLPLGLHSLSLERIDFSWTQPSSAGIFLASIYTMVW